ncbi:MAG: hypothetical protein V5A88_01500 [Candidatus Thermoplasmatota archaeon]
MKDFYELLIECLKYEGYEPVESQEGKIVVEKKTTEASSSESEEQVEVQEETVEQATLVVAGAVVNEDDLLALEESEGPTMLVVTEDVSQDILSSIPEDVEIWGREELIEKFGKMMLEKTFLEGVAEGEKGIKGPSQGFDFDIEHEGGERILAPIIEFEEVSELGEKMVKGFKYTLELVPHYLYDYRVEKEEGETAQGKLYLNSVSGKPNFWEKPFESMDEMKRSHVKLEPNIPQEESGKRALNAVMDKFTEKKEKRWEENGTTIVEKEHERPSAEDIDLQKRGVVYVPMWAVEGTDGIVVINAARGKVEREL